MWVRCDRSFKLRFARKSNRTTHNTAEFTSFLVERAESEVGSPLSLRPSELSDRELAITLPQSHDEFQLVYAKKSTIMFERKQDVR